MEYGKVLWSIPLVNCLIICPKCRAGIPYDYYSDPKIALQDHDDNVHAIGYWGKFQMVKGEMTMDWIGPMTREQMMEKDATYRHNGPVKSKPE